jgi:NAD(P)-dependent dehydrogenase (short-subunit alcohol dehydrogenase family)
MTDRLDGKVILVTGSGRGFGRAMAIAYASEGASIISTARSRDELREAERAMIEAGGKVSTIPTDLSNHEGIYDLTEQVIDRYGGIDILVNNAATSSWLIIEEMTIENWDRTMGVNLRAPFALSKLLYPSIKERGGGSIINITSRSAEMGFVAEIAYCPSKFGLERLTQCLALELKPHNIAVNSLNAASPPGKKLKPTELTIEEAGNMPENIRERYTGDWELVNHFRDAWVFLALQDASGITGMRLDTGELSRVLREEGAEGAYTRWKGKRMEAVYKPVDWPKKVKYQTKEGGWEELVI